MKKVVVFLVMTLVFSMMGVAKTYALDFGENMDIVSRESVLLIALQIIFLFVGASIVRIDQRTVGKALLATLGIAVFFFFMSMLTAESNIESIGLLLIVGILSVVVIQKVCNTTFMKALGAFFFTWGADAVALLVIP
jgi:hypothetical protein